MEASFTDIFPKMETIPPPIYCRCKEVKMTFETVPSFTVTCHCGPCRAAFKRPSLDCAVFMDTTKVRIEEGDENVEMYPAVDIGEGKFQLLFCRNCGELLMHYNKFHFVIIQLDRFRVHDELPEDYAPKFHLCYKERIQNVYDGLIKFWSFPKFLGGPGRELTEDGQEVPDHLTGSVGKRYNKRGDPAPLTDFVVGLKALSMAEEPVGVPTSVAANKDASGHENTFSRQTSKTGSVGSL